MLSENILFSIFKNKNKKYSFLVVKHVFLFFFLENKKLFLKTVVKQALNFHIGSSSSSLQLDYINIQQTTRTNREWKKRMFPHKLLGL